MNSANRDTQQQEPLLQKAGWQDLLPLWELEKKCFSKADAWPLLDLLGALSFPGYLRFKLSLDEKLIGFIGAEVKDGLGWITTIEVDPQYRGRGYGRLLLETAENALGTDTVRLITRQSNATAIRLYEKAGYASIGLWTSYYAGGEDGLVMEKVLPDKRFA